MLALLRIAARVVEALVAIPVRAFRLFLSTILFNPRLGRLRFLVAPVILYVVFALALVYLYAPIRGITGQVWMGDALRYANERSLGTAIYDANDRFVGIFDPVLDSEEDFNYLGRPIRLPDYIAYPDHKSLHVNKAPEHYWQCLMLHEDRHLGGPVNPFGIDLYGVLKIPFSTMQRTIQAGRPRMGAGGSSLSMQLARIFFKTPPSSNESAIAKMKRKLKEWWLAPVIYWELTKGGDRQPLKLWAANHFPHAQRTGGQPLYGVEQTSLILFGKSAETLSAAQQYVLAAAVNQPIILLEGGERLNARRAGSWRRIVTERARYCADKLIANPERHARAVGELQALAQTPPDPKTPIAISQAMAPLAPGTARRASASPIRRSNTLIPSAKYGVRDEMKNRFGYAWRSEVRGVHLTLDVAQNLEFRRRVHQALARTQARFRGQIDPRYSLNVAKARAPGDGQSFRVPDIVIAAADPDGRIIRFYESNYTTAYFGSGTARDSRTGRYDPSRESRFIASLAKMAAAVAIANQATDKPATGYLDTAAPRSGLEACKRGRKRRSRRAEVAFACSLNTPLEWRLGQIKPHELRRIAEGFKLTLPDPSTPLAKALVVGHVAASPRTVHRMAGMVLNALSRPETALPQPSLVRRFDDSETKPAPETQMIPKDSAAPNRLIEDSGKPFLEGILAAPICYRHGTLRRVSDWCAAKRPDLRLHFAKTGTRGTGARDPSAYDTVDLWVAGGIQFTNGPAYSYVILIGTGSPGEPWARDLFAGAASEQVLRVLLEDLAAHANPKPRSVKAVPAQPSDVAQSSADLKPQ